MKRSQAKLKEQRRKNKQAKGISRGVSNYAMKRRTAVNPDADCELCEFVEYFKDPIRSLRDGTCSLKGRDGCFLGLTNKAIKAIIDTNGQGCPEFSRAIL